MRRPILLLLAPALVLPAACGYRDPLDPTLPCEDLRLELVERSISPPANVSALVRVTDCRGDALGHRLEPTAFDLAENGSVLSLLEADRMIEPAERQMAERTLLLLDLSGSVVRSGLRGAMVAGARSLVAARSSAQQIAIFGFDGGADLIPFSYFTEDQVELGAALDRADSAELADNSTNLNGAVLAALEILDGAIAADERDVYTVAHGSLVVFTDGQDLAGRASDEAVAGALSATPHATFAIGVGSAVDDRSLERIGRTGRFYAGDEGGVSEAFIRAGSELTARSQASYVVSYCSPARAGARTLTITVRAGDLLGATSLEFDAAGFGAGCSPEGSPLR